MPVLTNSVYAHKDITLKFDFSLCYLKLIVWDKDNMFPLDYWYRRVGRSE
jgi:hypothetical protein